MPVFRSPGGILIWTCVPVLELFLETRRHGLADKRLGLRHGFPCADWESSPPVPSAGRLYAVLAACVFPVSAQSVSHIRPEAFPASAPFSTQLCVGWAGNLASHESWPHLHREAQNKNELLEVLRRSSDAKRGWDRDGRVFRDAVMQQVRVPLGSLFGGRIRLGGFNAVTPMEHIQRGLPGGGSLDPWSPAPMGHAGMILPKDDNQYGLVSRFILREARKKRAARNGARWPPGWRKLIHGNL